MSIWQNISLSAWDAGSLPAGSAPSIPTAEAEGFTARFDNGINASYHLLETTKLHCWEDAVRQRMDVRVAIRL